MNAGTTENPEYEQAAAEIERAMKFDDIPMQDRVIQHRIERNDADIEKMYRNINKAREYLNRIEADFLRTRADFSKEYLKQAI
jgi:hypothetical protein